MNKPFATVCFGNPYVAMALPKLPAVLVSYEFSDFNREGRREGPRGGDSNRRQLPISMPGLYPFRARADAFREVADRETMRVDQHGPPSRRPDLSPGPGRRAQTAAGPGPARTASPRGRDRGADGPRCGRAHAARSPDSEPASASDA